jgi:hypothetical protein
MYETHDHTETLWNEAQGQHVDLDVPEPLEHWSLEDFSDLVCTRRTTL